uniref:ARAD1D05676p n=1 Tax=Blastobotrys adeninivorans TaxID=409370 RepID=A0A060TEB5_BLAAD
MQTYSASTPVSQLLHSFSLTMEAAAIVIISLLCALIALALVYLGTYTYLHRQERSPLLAGDIERLVSQQEEETAMSNDRFESTVSLALGDSVRGYNRLDSGSHIYQSTQASRIASTVTTATAPSAMTLGSGGSGRSGSGSGSGIFKSLPPSPTLMPYDPPYDSYEPPLPNVPRTPPPAKGIAAADNQLVHSASPSPNRTLSPPSPSTPKDNDSRSSMIRLSLPLQPEGLLLDASLADYLPDLPTNIIDHCDDFDDGPKIVQPIPQPKFPGRRNSYVNIPKEHEIRTSLKPLFSEGFEDEDNDGFLEAPIAIAYTHDLAGPTIAARS